MRFRIEIFNPVDGSCRLMAVAGWLRIVCSHGLVVGTALMDLRQQHRQQLEVEHLRQLVKRVIESAGFDKETFERWLKLSVNADDFAHWVDTEACSQWGVKAAIRVFAIGMKGWDVEPVGDLRTGRPSEIDTIPKSFVRFPVLTHQ